MRPADLTLAAQAGRLLTAREVACLLHRPVAWFYRHRADLEAGGFPPAIPGLGYRWDREAIAAWLDRQIPADQRPPAPAADDDDPEILDWATRLDGRAAGTALEK